jgi:hypothetical protein
MSKNRQREELRHPFTHLQQIYVPVTGIGTPSPSVKSNLWIATQDKPDEVCGFARRVGLTDRKGEPQVLYRLKLKRHLATYNTATLPDFFVLENGVFVKWSQQSSTT